MKKEVYIQNLKCGGCANTITNELNKLEGFSNVQVDEENDRVSFDSTEEDVSALLIRLDELGYPPVDTDNSMFKKAKSYVSCMRGRMSD